jgi:site-specific DNA recombinase
MEKSRDACQHSVTLQEEQIQSILADTVCDGVYNESTLREKVKRIDVYKTQVIICFAEKDKYQSCELK